jgi:serine/threonine-protein kinase
MHTIGSVLAGKYRLLRLIGEGGIGRVFLAEQAPIGREVAVKLLHPELGKNPIVSGRFEREAKAAARVIHPNSVMLFDFGRDGETLYMVMEYLRGETLYDRLLARGRMPPEESVPLLSRVLDALDACHAAGLLHRDLKPENVMLARFGTREEVKLLDYGIAKIVNDESIHTTKTGHIIGTPPYMSPELISGEKSLIGPGTDLYAVGVMLYELLTGFHPFPADNHIDIFRQHLLAVPPKLVGRLSGSGYEYFDAILQKTLAKKPRERYLSANELREALESALERYTEDNEGERIDKTVISAPPSSSRNAATLILGETVDTTVKIDLSSMRENAAMELLELSTEEPTTHRLRPNDVLQEEAATSISAAPSPTLLVRCREFVRSLFSRRSLRGL